MIPVVIGVNIVIEYPSVSVSLPSSLVSIELLVMIFITHGINVYWFTGNHLGNYHWETVAIYILRTLVWKNRRETWK